MIKYNLQPCPFCGERESLSTHHGQYDSGGGWGQSDIRVVCNNCGGQGPANDQNKKTQKRDEDKAIRAWNRRAT